MRSASCSATSQVDLIHLKSCKRNRDTVPQGLLQGDLWDDFTRCVEGQERYPYSRAKGEPRSYQEFSKRMCRMIVWFWGSYSEPKCWILYDLHDSTGTFAGPLPPSSGGHFSAPDQQTPRGIEPAEQYPLCLLRVACHWWHWVLVLPYWEAFEKLLKKSRAACVGWMSSCGDLYPYDLWHDMHASKARRSRSEGNWCQPPTGLVFSQPYLHQAAPKHSRDRRLLKSDLGRLYDVIVSYISNFVFAYYIVLYTLYDYSKTYMLYIYVY